MITKIEAVITDGCEAHVDQETLENLVDLTTVMYQRMLDLDPRLHDGRGNCWVVAASAHGVAQALGLRSALYGGQVFNEAGEAMFTQGGHYWTVINKSVVVESPNGYAVIVWPLELVRRRLVPLKTSMRKMANMRKVRSLHKLADSVRDWAERGAPSDWSPASRCA